MELRFIRVARGHQAKFNLSAEKGDLGFMSQKSGISLVDRTCSYRGLSFQSALKRAKFVWVLPYVISRDGSSILLIDGGETKYFVCSFCGSPDVQPVICEVILGVAPFTGTSVFLQKYSRAVMFDLRRS